MAIALKAWSNHVKDRKRQHKRFFDLSETLGNMWRR
jgi:hypothetical protein